MRTGVALRSRMASLSHATNVVGLGSALGELWKNSPGKRKIVPYTNSAALHCRSLFRAALIPSKMSGRDSI